MDKNLIKAQLVKPNGEIRKTAPKDPIAREVYSILKAGTSLGGSGMLSYMTATKETHDFAREIGIELGILSPEGKSGTQITLEGDAISVKWYGMPGTGSLGMISASGVASTLNTLDLATVCAVYACAKGNPYAADRKAVLEYVISKFDPSKLTMTLGQVRLAVLKLNGGSINGPVDAYLDCAKNLRKAA